LRPGTLDELAFAKLAEDHIARNKRIDTVGFESTLQLGPGSKDRILFTNSASTSALKSLHGLK